MKGEYIRVPLGDVQVPHEGFVCLLNRWWLVEDGFVLGYRLRPGSKERLSPQCNSDRAVVESVLAKSVAHRAVFIPVAYWWPDKD